MNRNHFFEKLSEYRKLPEGYYHLVFDSIEDGELFHNESEFAMGMNSVAIGQYVCGLIIIVFNWMVNHGHFLVWGSGDRCVDFFLNVKRRLNSVLVSTGQRPLAGDYGMKLVRVQDERQLTDVVVYICRNPYKALSNRTPSGYIWGTNYLLFSDLPKIISKVPIQELPVAFLRRVIGSRVKLPDNYLFNKELGFILPESYARMDVAAKALGNSSNYCTKLLRNIDAHIKISEGIGEKVKIDDNELDYTIWSIVKNQFGASSVAELGTNEKCRLAMTLHKKYFIEPKRICRKVGLPLSVVQDLLR